MVNKMLSVAKCCEENVIDETWKGRSVAQSNWDKKYILETKYGSINNRNSYMEDYEKMKKIEDKLDSILEIICNTFSYPGYMVMDDYIMKMKKETKKMEKLLKECYFFEVDDFYAIKYFLYNRDMLKYDYERILKILIEYEHLYEVDYINDHYEIFKKEIWPKIIKIKDVLLRRAIYKMK